jgi:hypothetical protein
VTESRSPNEPPTRITGEKIGLSARKISAMEVVNRSGRHKAQQVFGKDDAVAWVERAKQATALALEQRKSRQSGGSGGQDGEV